MCMSTQEYAPTYKYQMSTKELLEIGAGKSMKTTRDTDTQGRKVKANKQRAG